MDLNDKVSIIMPCYNDGKFLRDSIDSVIRQIHKNWELIIVDDCSKDNPKSIVDEFNDSRILFTRNEKNMGAAFSRNKAMDLASGKYIAFLDGDDVWSEDKLAKQLEFISKTGASFVASFYYVMDEFGNLQAIVSAPERISRKMMYRCGYIGCLTAMFEKDLVPDFKVDPFLKKRNDYAIWLKVMKKIDTCYVLPEPLAYYRKHSGGISNTSSLKLLKWHYLLFRKQERKTVLGAAFFTARNGFYFLRKKRKFVRKIQDLPQ